MAISIRKESNPVKGNVDYTGRTNTSDNKIVYEYRTVRCGIPHPPIGMPVGSPLYTFVHNKPIKIPQPPPIEMPEANLERAISYGADASGCYWWRLGWPEYLLNIGNKAIVSSLSQMIFDINFYLRLKSVKIQRQATDAQTNFVKELAKLREQNGMSLVYEVDDIVFKDDIPDYNRCKEAFLEGNIADNIMELMNIVDEITVTCDFMKKYYQEKTGNKKVTIVPNYIPKFWADRFYDKKRLQENFDKNKKKPRILYAGSGTHVDILNKTGGKDDFQHILSSIIKARKDFQFVFKGCFPIQVKPFIDSGEMEYVKWSPLQELPQGIMDLNCQAVFAPLADNTYNKSKSEIKLLESGALGIPGAFQDICTYSNATTKFQTGDELIDQLKNITKNKSDYMKHSDLARKYVETMWLEDHISEAQATYFTKFGSPERNKMSPNLIKLNPDQKSS